MKKAIWGELFKNAIWRAKKKAIWGSVRCYRVDLRLGSRLSDRW